MLTCQVWMFVQLLAFYYDFHCLVCCVYEGSLELMNRLLYDSPFWTWKLLSVLLATAVGKQEVWVLLVLILSSKRVTNSSCNAKFRWANSTRRSKKILIQYFTLYFRRFTIFNGQYTF
ncbi:hypothetical protein BDF20DRAFT_520478 [Mycotypha africana]|uniref:uncharacterized protein n=1 Tax=Mycotypha africana TaxID=64632 RepID=UPI0023007D5B|nr:uncharacterized protein BDF20DRAFT_520478 [Mycotypha africana]KAI8979597.1 hypothetical protein BDF20DRAFT_520478 [Mycotypha africana]